MVEAAISSDISSTIRAVVPRAALHFLQAQHVRQVHEGLIQCREGRFPVLAGGPDPSRRPFEWPALLAASASRLSVATAKRALAFFRPGAPQPSGAGSAARWTAMVLGAGSASWPRRRARAAAAASPRAAPGRAAE